MYRLTGRISKGNSIVGYEITDGRSKINMSKQDIMILAKQGQIECVKVSGDALTGTNGFELKKLPTVNMEKEMDKFKPHEIFATINRNVHNLDLNSLNAPHLGALGKSICLSEIQQGKLRKDMMHLNSGRIEVEERICNDDIPALIRYLENFNDEDPRIRKQIKGKCLKLMADLSMDEGASDIVSIGLNAIVREILPIVKDKLDDSALPNFIGYRVRASQSLNNPLHFKKLAYGTDEVIGEGILEPGESVLISKAELALLASRPTINGELSNAVMKLRRLTSKGPFTSPYDFLSSNIFVRKTNDTPVFPVRDITSNHYNLSGDELVRFLSAVDIDRLILVLGIKFLHRDEIEQYLDQFTPAELQKIMELCNTIGDICNKLPTTLNEGSVEFSMDASKYPELNNVGKLLEIAGVAQFNEVDNSTTVTRTNNTNIMINESHKKNNAIQKQKKGLMGMFKR